MSRSMSAVAPSPWRLPIAATGRSRSDRTIIFSRPIRRCASIATRRAACGSTFRPGPRCASSRGRAETSRSWPTRAIARSSASARTSWAGSTEGETMPVSIPRRVYADMFGPTTGDKVRLADTDLIIEVEKDFTVYGEEVKFGGGKVIRDGMGQSQATNKQGAADTVITNALIVDHWGIVKADVAITEGYISAIGKAGNPDIQPGVTIVIGPGTDVIAGEGKILTAGGFDSHIHFIC